MSFVRFKKIRPGKKNFLGRLIKKRKSFSLFLKFLNKTVIEIFLIDLDLPNLFQIHKRNSENLFPKKNSKYLKGERMIDTPFSTPKRSLKWFLNSLIFWKENEGVSSLTIRKRRETIRTLIPDNKRPRKQHNRSL